MNFDEFFSRGDFDRLYYGSFVVTSKTLVTKVILNYPEPGRLLCPWNMFINLPQYPG